MDWCSTARCVHHNVLSEVLELIDLPEERDGVSFFGTIPSRKLSALFGQSWAFKFLFRMPHDPFHLLRYNYNFNGFSTSKGGGRCSSSHLQRPTSVLSYVCSLHRARFYGGLQCLGDPTQAQAKD
nr:hypothetical protein CFP56_55318 [Quercus suber]